MANINILVTCPGCQHTHTIAVDEDLARNPGSERMYKLAEVEKILGLSRRTLKQLIYDGKLAASKMTRGNSAAWKVTESELSRFKRERGE